MSFEQPNLYSDEEREKIAEIEKQRTLSDAELLQNGAKYVIDESGNKRLDVTDDHVERAHEMMEGKREDLFSKNKEKLMLFETLKVQVRAAYSETDGSNLGIWYRNNYKKHEGWPSNPNIRYKGHGWKSWRDLVGKPEEEENKFLPFDEFKQQVLIEYEKSSKNMALSKWYFQNYKSYPGWPSNPIMYTNKGWKGFGDLQGRPIQRKSRRNDTLLWGI